MYRQGDILIIPVSELPKLAKSIEADNGRIILAEGEATGHAHSIVATAEVELFAIADEVDRFLRVRSRAVALRHDEHATITIPPGDYIVRRQREYAPGEIRQVAD